MVPLAPGTGGDVMARLVLNGLSQTLGQSIVIENKGGAGGTIGAGQVAKADPDGYTLLVHSSTHVIAPSLYTNLPYDTANDFAAVARRQRAERARRRAVEGLQELEGVRRRGESHARRLHLRLGRRRLDHASDRRALPPQRGLSRRCMCRSAAAAFSPRSSPAASTSAIRRSRPRCRTSRKAGCRRWRCRARKRASALPDVPTTLEVGYADSDYVIWVGLFLPAKTPREIVEKLNLATRKALGESGPARAARRARRHADADDARRIRRAGPAGDRRQRRAGQGRRA